MDLKVDESGFACCVFTERDLIFVRMNGNHAFPRICDYIATAARQLPVTAAQVTTFVAEHPNYANTLPATVTQVNTFLAQNPNYNNTLPVTVTQVDAFLAQNPEFCQTLPINEQQVLRYLEQNRKFSKNLETAFFARLLQSCAYSD